MYKIHISNELSKLVKNSSIFLSFSILNRAIPFLLLPILTAYIDPYGYGVIAVMAIVTSLSMPLIGLCSDSVLFQQYFKLDQSSKVNFINDAYKIVLINTLIIIVIAVPFANLIKDFTDLSLKWFEIAIICASAGMITTLTTQIFLLKKKAFNYGLFMTINALINGGLAILFVVIYELSWQGRAYSLLISAIFMACIAIFMNIREKDVGAPSLRFTNQAPIIFKLGSALIPSAVGGWAIAMTDRVFLTTMTSLDIVGIYAVGIMIAQMIDIFLNALARAFYPILSEYGDTQDIAKKIFLVRGIYIFTFIAALAVTFLYLASPIIFNFMINERYHDALQVVLWISLGYAFTNIGGLFLSLLLMIKKNVITIFISSATVIFSIISAYFLIKQYGMIGAAISNALSGFINMTMLIIVLNHYNSFPWFNRKIITL